MWEGNRAASDAAARDLYGRLCDRHLGNRDLRPPPTERIAAYVRALLHGYPDIGSEAREDSPWAVAPLLGNASGPFLYLGMVYSQSEEASAWASQVAAEHGLVCYDPQLDKLRR